VTTLLTTSRPSFSSKPKCSPGRTPSLSLTFLGMVICPLDVTLAMIIIQLEEEALSHPPDPVFDGHPFAPEAVDGGVFVGVAMARPIRIRSDSEYPHISGRSPE